ncbi:MAG: hypothetical protein V4647_14750 [Pseudomonadota bacterium]
MGDMAFELVDYEVVYRGLGAGVPAGVVGGAPTPDPSRGRAGDWVAQPAPLPPAGGAGGGFLAAGPLPAEAEATLARDPILSPHTFGPLPLLDLPLQALFCEHLARHGNVRLACRAARVSPQTAYRMRRASATFRRLWNAALVVARDQVEDVLADRAINGWDEAVFYHGEEVATRRRYDSRLLLAHLGRLDKLAEREGAAPMVAQFDHVIEAMARGEEPVLAAAEAPVAEAPVEQVADLVGDDEASEETGDDRGEGVPLLEAQLQWLEAHHGALTEEEEAFHLLNTVPGVPGCALRAFGWRGRDAASAGPVRRDERAEGGVTAARC